MENSSNIQNSKYIQCSKVTKKILLSERGEICH